MDTTKKLSIAKLDFVQVCGLSLNFYNNTLRKFLQIQRQSKDLNKSNFAIGWLTNQQTISLASSALKSVLSWSISIIQNPWLYQAGDTRIPLPRKSVWTPKLDFVQVCGPSLNFYNKPLRNFTNSATVGRLEQVQLCNRLIDQSADNITGLKCAKECLILKYISISRILGYTRRWIESNMQVTH